MSARKFKISNIMLGFLLLLGLFSLFAASSCGNNSTTTTAREPAMTIDVNKQYTVTMKVVIDGELMGDITIELFPQDAPHAVNNFVYLVNKGFYNGLTFHRIIKDFVVQGGDPLGTGTGGPGYKFIDDRPITRDYIPGTLAMANSGPDTNGSQFFITLTNLSDPPTQDEPYSLTKDYVIFGLVRNGFDIVQQMGNVPTDQYDAPTVDVHIAMITITES